MDDDTSGAFTALVILLLGGWWYVASFVTASSDGWAISWDQHAGLVDGDEAIYVGEDTIKDGRLCFAEIIEGKETKFRFGCFSKSNLLNASESVNGIPPWSGFSGERVQIISITDGFLVIPAPQKGG